MTLKTSRNQRLPLRHSNRYEDDVSLKSLKTVKERVKEFEKVKVDIDEKDKKGYRKKGEKK